MAVKFNQYLSFVKDQRGVIDQLSQALSANDQAEVQDLLGEIKENKKRRDQAAFEVGMSECGTG